MAKFGVGGGSFQPIFQRGASDGAGGLAGIFQRGNGGILPERGSAEQRDMVFELLQSGMGQAQGSGSPLLAALAPMIGGAVGTRTQALYDRTQDAAKEQSTSDLLELMGNNPKAAAALDVLNREDVPDHLKSLASSMLGSALKPKTAAKPEARKMREDVNGVLRYLDSGDEVFPGVVPNASGNSSDMLRQKNVATELLADAINNLTLQGYTDEEARQMIKDDPIYSAQWSLLSQMNSGPAIGAAPMQSPAPSTGAPPPPPPGTVPY